MSKAKNTNLNTSDLKITIPVVVFVVSSYSGAIENITDTQVISQISALNNYYTNYGISFCLAKKNAIDQNTTGILRAVSPLSNHNAQADQQSLNNLFPYYPSSRYLKIWVVKDINGIGNGAVQGYATFPGATASLEGIVMRYTAFGDVATCSCTILNSQTEKGKILTHEVGHYLGLYHTFHQSCSGMNASTCNLEGDRVCDTPPVANPNNGCPLISTNTCHETSPDLPDDIHNYMDYVNENCMTQFTGGQKQRMIDVLNTSRSMLVSEENLILTGVACLPSLLSANFKANNYDVCSSNTNPIIFTPGINPIGSTYTWDFGDGTTAQYVSTTQNTTQTHIYNVANDLPYNVQLTVSNGINSVTNTKQIFVNNCTPILNPDSNWRFSGEPLALDFSTGVPTQVIVPSNAYYHYEGVANQSNSSGQLLFHSNGEKIWNVNNTIISSVLTGHSSAHQGTLILQNPGNINQYYVFTRNGQPQEQPIRTGLRYSLVNVSGSSVLPMTPSETNIVVTTPSGLGYTLTNDYGIEGGEGISAIKSCDGYWVITTGQKVTGYFLMVYKLNALGLTFVNETALNTSMTTNLLSIEASPDGNKIVLSGFDRRFNQINYFGGTYLYDFNKFNGTISNPINLNQNFGYGASFSPDSKLLYLNSGLGLFQYDINNVNPLSSMARIFESRLPAPNDIQKGPDGKLYVASRGYNKYGVIHKPNNKITNDNPNTCFFTFDGPISTTINILPSGLPNFVDAKEETTYPNIATISSFPINCNTFKFVPNLCYNASFIWDFGDAASGSNNIYTGTVASHTFSSNGTYTIRLKDSNNVEITTTTVTIGIPLTTILGSTTVCASEANITTNNSVVLLPGQTALWNISAGNGIISGLNNQSEVTINWATLPGTITLTITNQAGCTSTVTKIINSSPQPTIPTITGQTYACDIYNETTTNSTTIVPGTTITWSITGGAGTIIGSNSQSSVDISWSSLPGIISLTVTSPEGCTTTTTQTIAKGCACDIMDANYFTASQVGNTVNNFQFFNSITGTFGGPVMCDYGDGTAPTSDPISHTYTTNGTYIIDMLFYAKQCSFHYYQTVVISTNIAKSSTSELSKSTKNTSLAIYNYDMFLYPNPTSSEININLDMEKEGEIDINILTLDSKIINTKKWKLKEGKQTITFKLPYKDNVVQVSEDDVKKVVVE